MGVHRRLSSSLGTRLPSPPSCEAFCNCSKQPDDEQEPEQAEVLEEAIAESVTHHLASFLEELLMVFFVAESA